jgi:phospholipid/cholesterol/gamma-HCH transport system substrate-binding protein
MRSRTIREGSVGLLILVGVGVFVGLVLWLRNISIGDRTYKFTVTFADAVGLKEGASVRYRGVNVGRITQVTPQTNGVDTTVAITSPNLLIPKNVSIEANQAGFVGETSIDITPRSPKIPLPQNAQAINPQTPQCNSALFICNQERINGQIGVSFIELLRSGTDLATRYSDPRFFDNVNTLTKNASVAASEAAKLSAELSLLSRTARRELGTVSTTATSLTTSANQTLNQVGSVASRLANTADKFGNTADQYSLSGAQLNRLLISANQLVVSNRGSLVGTLDSVRQTSDQLRVLLSSLTPTVNQINTTVGQLNATTGQIRVGELVKNLETLSANAAQASANLRDITTSLNNPNNVNLLQQTLDNAVKVSANLRDITGSLNNPNNTVLLQQTLDSARATFENTQKITSDLDELTGDPAFRENVRRLVNGLGKLVSSTQQLQQQVEVAQQLEPVSSEINTAIANASAIPSGNQQSQPKVEQAASPTQPSTDQQFLLLPPAPKKLLPEATSQIASDSEREKR